MLIIKDIKNLRVFLDEAEKTRKIIGFVPTMGALHNGHLELIKRSKKNNDLTVVSIFVNELQFNSKSDYEDYPVNKGKDIEMCISENVDILFEPHASEIYSNDYVQIKNNFFNNILCDPLRPGHFDGVLTVLNILFSIVVPAKTYFGLKDFQQYKVVKKFINENYSNISILGVPTKRDENNIPLSSRNLLLNKKQMNKFIFLYKIIGDLKKNFVQTDTVEFGNEFIIKKNFLKNETEINFEYFEFRNSENLKKEGLLEHARLFLCFYIGKTRLIDNLSWKELAVL